MMDTSFFRGENHEREGGREYERLGFVRVSGVRLEKNEGEENKNVNLSG